ncbi:hypothetical protein C1J03_22385 [Sulfitobacter sp. SK012]|uniref:MBOAT family O-acyltransferase n=1 Tax=Sulfitobacter sp. SK012 TaxID=1389005 RepID=UPI000E0B3F94|nr:MBOAT family O-acyltransferase [Sulfitobacter sp. SK012]AXI48501.1 hypothetical protein C1J03_22385 [Sulfitobacter sp. SK012]
MAFVTLSWILWLWGTVLVYWLSPGPVRLLVLALVSLVFLLVYDPLSAALLCIFALMCHIAGNRESVPTAALAAVVSSMVAILIFFKIGVVNRDLALLQTVLIPLGLSFYTFRCVHFMMERYTGRVPICSLRELISYLFFLPTLVVGPIHRIDDYLKDMARQRFDPRMLSEGAERIVYGYVKLAVISNFLVERLFGEWILEHPDQDGALVAYLLIVKNGLNVYLQFSGYSDIAIGFARMLGFRVLENFNWPYLQPNISSFWRSWHISLSRWCREYIYETVVSITRNPALGAISTMLVIGMWHEISTRYIIWGIYHGLGLVIWQYWQGIKARWMPTVPQPLVGFVYALSVLLTVHFVWFGFVIIYSGGLRETLVIFDKVFLWWL